MAATTKPMSRTASSVSTGTKRKRSEPKFYAVRNGHTPGVYQTWADCQEQINGFKKAIFKSFPTLTEAESFVTGDTSSTNAGYSSAGKFYAVKRGKVPGIYTDWAMASSQITDFAKPVHRSFQTYDEARRYLDSGTPKTDDGSEARSIGGPGSIAAHENPIINGTTPQGDQAAQAPKKRKITKPKAQPALPVYDEDAFDAGFGPLPPGAIDGFDPNIRLDAQGNVVYKTHDERRATRPAPSDIDQTRPIRIYTDGSSIKNGQTGALAGVGVYFGPRDPRNVSEPLAGPRQTNQRAELTAVQRALDFVPRNRDAVIITDSKYTIDCLTNWFQGWRRNGWKTAAGKAVENRDLIEHTLTKIEERARLRVRTDFEWVKGHASTEGNVEADKLAVNGARQAAGSG